MRNKMDIKQYWFVLWELTKRELKRKYARSFLGILWSCVYPLMRMALVVVLFSTIFNKGIEKYPAYYFVGFLIFEFFATATQTSLTTLKDNRNLLIKSKLPRELFVLSRVLTAFVNFLLGCIPFAAVLAWYRARVTWYYLMIPVVLLLLLFFTAGMSYVVSIWFVFQRDAMNIYSNFTFILRFFVAMFYSVGKTQQIIERRVDELRQNMFVIHQLVIRDKKRSLSSTFMGELWEVINPLINMVVMVLVFGKMFGYGIKGGFPLYVLTGTTLYGLYTSGTTMCLNALMGNKNFLIKTQLNKSIYVVQKILLAVRYFLFSMLIYAFMIATYRIVPSVTWLLFVPDVIGLLIMMLGIGKMLAVINVTFADITYFYKIFTLFLMYGSAIFYRVDRLSPTLQKAMTILNPLYTVISIARESIIERSFPHWKLWVVLSMYAMGCYIVGTIFFNRKIEDIVAKM